MLFVAYFDQWVKCPPQNISVLWEVVGFIYLLSTTRARRITPASATIMDLNIAIRVGIFTTSWFWPIVVINVKRVEIWDGWTWHPLVQPLCLHHSRCGDHNLSRVENPNYSSPRILLQHINMTYTRTLGMLSIILKQCWRAYTIYFSSDRSIAPVAYSHCFDPLAVSILLWFYSILDIRSPRLFVYHPSARIPVCSVYMNILVLYAPTTSVAQGKTSQCIKHATPQVLSTALGGLSRGPNAPRLTYLNAINQRVWCA